MALTRTPLGRLAAGDVVYEKRGRRFQLIGTVESAEKNAASRSVYVRCRDAAGELVHWRQNWAAHLYVKSTPKEAT